MGRTRPKVKTYAKKAQWARGQSSTSNPDKNKHRLKALSKFGQPILNTPAKPSTTNGITALTTDAILKHDARQVYLNDGKKLNKSEPTVHDLALSMRSFSVSDGDGDDDMSEGRSYAKTFQTFGSQYSACTNMTFNKFLNRFQQKSDMHKEMLAILSAITEVIKERNGTQSSTEFFLGLMETLEAAKEENETIATLSLLTMVIKSVPQPVLRKKYTDVGPIFLQLLEQFSDSENQNVLRSIIGSISVLLRAQEYATWSASLTLKLFNNVLSFVIHTKPHVRKAAQRAIESVIHGCCFMVPLNPDAPKVTIHPAGTFVAKFCIEHFKPENVTKSQTVVLHAVELLKKTLAMLKNDDIKEICEHLLSIMITSKVLVQKSCFETLDQLFCSKSPNLSGDLLGKLIAAIYEYRPEASDVNLTLAWLNVMKHGHICFIGFNQTKCLMELPRFITVCASDIWKSENLHIATGAGHTIKELFEECVQPGCETEALVNLHRKPIVKMINEVAKCLSEPFGHVSQQVVGVFQTIFEVCGSHYPETLQPILNQIAARYDDKASKQIQIENTVRAAIATMGPEAAFKAVPLTDSTGAVVITRLWILQALKKSTKGSTFEYFYCHIMPLANRCHDNWKKFQSEENLASARTNELFYIQLWDLFPSFCENPRDLNKFGSIARTLGDAIRNRVEIRVAVFEGLKKLLQNASDEAKKQLSRFARNFLNILLNIYIKKPTGTEEHTSRISAMEIVEEYLKVAPADVLHELFQSILTEYKTKERIDTIEHKIQELNTQLDRNADEEKQIDAQQAKRIQAACDFLKSLILENEMGIEYIEGNQDEINEMLMIVPPKRLQLLFKSTQQTLNTFAYQSYFELLMSLAVYQSPEELKDFFLQYIEPTLRNAKVGGVSRLIKERQVKSYELLKNILQSENAGCKKFVAENLLQIQKTLVNTLQNRKQSSQNVRLECLLLLIEKEESKLQHNSKLVSRTIPEIVLSFNTQAVKQKEKNIPLTLLLKIGEIFQKANKLNELVESVMTGFYAEGDDTVIANTVQVLHAILQNFAEHLTLTNLNSILEQVLAQLVTGSRQKAKASLLFLLVFVKILPASYVANHLPNIVKTLSAMKADTKRFYRKQLGFIYKRLCKRFTPEEIVQLVPGNDEITHKKLKNIRKALARSKRLKAAENAKENSDEEDMEEEGDSDEDILADSDSDDELQEDILMDTEDKPQQRVIKKARSREQKFIHEDANTIVDLADTKAMSSIASSKPAKGGTEAVSEKQKSKDPNRGFKVDITGKLIIEEPKRGGRNNDDTDSDDDEDLEENENGNNGAANDDESDSDDEAAENAKLKSRKRKASSTLSMKSGKTGTSSKYVAGGKGIHRPLNSAASVRSGYSQKTAGTSKTNATSAYGSEYRSNKATGDVKRKGQAVDPYAYIPLSRNTLNKRKRAKNSGQFKSIVHGARKGAAAGSKNKRRKM